MADDFNKNFNDWKKQLQEAAEFQKKLNSGMGEYLKAVRDIGDIQKQINHSKKVMVEMDEEIVKLSQKEKDINEKLAKDLLPAEREELEKQLGITKKLIVEEKKRKRFLDSYIKNLEKETAEYSKQVKEVNKLALATKSIAKGLVKTPDLIKKGYGELKKTGIFDMDKEIRNAARSMGVGNRQYKAFANTMMTAADSTTMMGVNVKDLAKMQRGYSEEIGRSVKLTEGGLKAMAGMAEGTGLGTEFAVQMAASMDNFGMSVEASADVVEETMNTADKMGVNSAKAVKSMQKNLKLAQRFHFKGGVKSLIRMSAEAEKLKLDLDGISGMAEKVFRPEGAIEMSAQLATMGGNFSKLGDPMQMMFKARNDFEGFAKDIGKATSEFVSFNKENGEFQIKGGLAADRMREISKITGISVEKLQEMAVQQKKMEQIGSVMPISMDKESREFIESQAQFKDGQWVINIDGKEELVKNLKGQDKRIKAEKKTLEQRAKDAQTFDETITNLMLTLKQTLLPFAIELKDWVGKPLQNLVEEWRREGFFSKIRDFAKSAGELAGGIGKFVVSAVEWLGPKGTLALLLGGSVFFNAAKWIMNGRMLAMGFNSVASVGGGSGYGPSGGGKGKGRGKSGKAGRAGRWGGRLGKATKWGGRALGALGLGFDAYSQYQAQSESGMGTGENIAKTGTSTAAKGLGAWGGAELGASIGLAGGPVGAAIGGLLGGVGGYFGGEAFADWINGMYGGETKPAYQGYQGGNYGSAIDRTAVLNDGVIFNPKDKFIKLNDALIAGTNVNGNKDLAKAMVNNGGEVEHRFNDMNINININANGLDNEIGENLLNKREFIRSMQTKIQEEIRINLAGGKLNPNPLKV